MVLWSSPPGKKVLVFLQLSVWASLCRIAYVRPQGRFHIQGWKDIFSVLLENLIFYSRAYDLWHHKMFESQLWPNIQHNTENRLYSEVGGMLCWAARNIFFLIYSGISTDADGTGASLDVSLGTCVEVIFKVIVTR